MQFETSVLYFAVLRHDASILVLVLRLLLSKQLPL